MTYIHLRSLLRRGSQFPLANLFVGEGLIPLLQPLQVVHTLTILFNKMGGGEHLSNMKNKACKDYSKALNSNYCFSKSYNLS